MMNQTPLSVSLLQPAEHDLVRDMIIALYSQDGSDKEQGGMTVEKIRQTMIRSSEDPEHLSIDVIRIQENVAGYAILFRYWSNDYGGVILNIDELYIRPAFRNQSIASQYIQQLEKYHASHCAALTLEVIRGNTGALELYRRLGFEETGRQHLIHYPKK